MIRCLAALALCLCWVAPAHAASRIALEELRLEAQGLSDAPLRVRIYLPPDYEATQARYQVLYVNDGQDMEAVDMAATLSRLSLVQTQMQASYQLISTLSSLSLVKYLPVG
jgi:hypothetical protein